MTKLPSHLLEFFTQLLVPLQLLVFLLPDAAVSSVSHFLVADNLKEKNCRLD